MRRVAALLPALWLLLPAVVLAGQLSVSPVSIAVPVGATAAVNLVLAGASGLVSVFDVTVRYDPTVVSFAGATFASAMGDESLNEVLTSVDHVTQDSVDVFGLSLLPEATLTSLQAGSVVVVTLNFVAVGPGTTPVAIEAARLGDASGDLPGPSVTGGSVVVGSQNGALSVSASVTQPVVAVGQTLAAGGSVSNSGLPGAADFYVGILRPDGSIQFFTSTGTAAGLLADPKSFIPIATGVSLTTAFSTSEPSFLALQRTAADPTGSYLFFILALEAGALTSGTVSNDAVLGLATAPFSFP